MSKENNEIISYDESSLFKRVSGIIDSRKIR
jgi:hypothetical protein